MSFDEIRARAADGEFPLTRLQAAAVRCATGPLRRTSYGVSAAEFNETLPQTAHDASTLAALGPDEQKRATIDIDPDGDPTVGTRHFQALDALDRGLVKTAGADVTPDPWRLMRPVEVSPAGQRALAVEAARLADGGNPVIASTIKQRSRRIAAEYPTTPILKPPIGELGRSRLSLKTPHAHGKTEWDAALDEAEFYAEAHEKQLLVRLGFHALNFSVRVPFGHGNRHWREAKALGLVSSEQRGPYSLHWLTPQGERQMSELPLREHERTAHVA